MSLRLTRILLAGAAIAAMAAVLPAAAADQTVPTVKQSSESAAPAQSDKVASTQPGARPARTSMRPTARRGFVVKRRPAQFAQRFMSRTAAVRYSRPHVARTWAARPAVRYALLNVTRVHHTPMIFVGVGY